MKEWLRKGMCGGCHDITESPYSGREDEPVFAMKDDQLNRRAARGVMKE